MISTDESCDFQDEWKNELLPFAKFDGTLFANFGEESSLLFVAVLVRPTRHFVVIKMGMELWDSCVRMTKVYRSDKIKLRVGVSKIHVKHQPGLLDDDFGERICSFSGPAAPFPASGHLSFDQMSRKLWISDGDFIWPC